MVVGDVRAGCEGMCVVGGLSGGGCVRGVGGCEAGVRGMWGKKPTPAHGEGGGDVFVCERAPRACFVCVGL